MRSKSVVVCSSGSSKPPAIRRATCGANTSITSMAIDKKTTASDSSKLNKRHSSALPLRAATSLNIGTNAELTSPPTSKSYNCDGKIAATLYALTAPEAPNKWLLTISRTRPRILLSTLPRETIPAARAMPVFTAACPSSESGSVSSAIASGARSAAGIKMGVSVGGEVIAKASGAGRSCRHCTAHRKQSQIDAHADTRQAHSQT